MPAVSYTAGLQVISLISVCEPNFAAEGWHFALLTIAFVSFAILFNLCERPHSQPSRCMFMELIEWAPSRDQQNASRRRLRGDHPSLWVLREFALSGIIKVAGGSVDTSLAGICRHLLGHGPTNSGTSDLPDLQR